MKKLITLIFIALLACIYCFSGFAIDVPTDSLTFVGADYNGSEDYFNSFSSVGASAPSGYILAGVLVEPHDFSNGHTRARYFYLPSTSDTFTFYVTSTGRATVSKVPNSENFYEIVNRFDPEYQQFHVSSGGGSVASFTSPDSNWIFYSFLDVIDHNGVETPVPSHIPFDLNTLLIDHNLYFNASTTSELSTLTNGVEFYVFPSSFPVSSTPVTVYSDVNVLTVPADDAYFQQRHFSSILANIDKALSDNVTHMHTILNASYTRSSPLTSFNPDSYNLSYEYLGKWLLFTTGSSLASDARSFKYIDLRQVSRTGVWSNSSLCLVATWRHDGLYSVARWDFNIDTILNQTSVVPSGITHFTPAPSTGTVSDLQGLADYIKNLGDTNFTNMDTLVNNLVGGVGSLPWAEMVGTGFGAKLPELSMYLDSLFDGLFAKYTAPTEEQINNLVNEVNEERAYLREKLAFVADVKSEVFFIQSTFISAGDSPRPFRVTLPSFMMGYTTDSHQEAIVRYDLIDNNTRQAMHDVIIVFCTLAVVMHIWHTLPATVGNMPRE